MRAVSKIRLMRPLRVLGAMLIAVALGAGKADADLITSNTLFSPSVIDFSQFAPSTPVGEGIQVGGLVGEDVFLTEGCCVGGGLVWVPMADGFGAGQQSRCLLGGR